MTGVFDTAATLSQSVCQAACLSLCLSARLSPTAMIPVNGDLPSNFSTAVYVGIRPVYLLTLV
jgi:hypothetical protein